MSNANFEKQEITVSLLSVRAGLSTLSKITDKIDDENQKVKEAREKLKAIETAIEDIPNHIESISKKISDLENWNEELNTEIGRKQKNYKKRCCFFYEITLHDGLAPIFYISLILSIMMICVQPTLEYLIFLVVPLIVFAISLVCGITFTIINKKTNNPKKDREQNLNKGRIYNNIDTISFYKKQIKDYKNQLDSLLEEKKINEDNLLFIREKTSQVLSELKETAKTIADGLNVNYGHLITESDWENVDLIIYYFNTGRASSMKEALYQVDRQRQNNDLIKAIKSSTYAICTHIRMATTMLATQLNESFAILQSNIKTLIENNNIQNKNLLTLVEGQIDANKMTNALLEKQNRTSLQLYEDYKRMQNVNGQWVYV